MRSSLGTTRFESVAGVRNWVMVVKMDSVGNDFLRGCADVIGMMLRPQALATSLALRLRGVQCVDFTDQCLNLHTYTYRTISIRWIYLINTSGCSIFSQYPAAGDGLLACVHQAHPPHIHPIMIVMTTRSLYDKQVTAWKSLN